MTPATENSYNPAPRHGGRFVNLSGRGPHGLRSVIRWMRTREKAAWPATVDNGPAPTPVARVTDASIRVTLIGHATVLLQVAGLNILTDPIWSARAGPLSWLGVKRVRAPAIAIDDLPPIDVVLLSHNHYDHLDRPTLAQLARRDRPLVVTGLRNAHAVPGDHVIELDWWQNHALNAQVRASYVPAEHFSSRTPFDRNVSLWGGFVIETPGGPIYFAGDTADGPHFALIAQRFGPMTLSLLPIGAYAPRWFMARVHIDPAEAFAAHATLQSRVSLAIHFGVFPLADDDYDAPAQALSNAIAAQPQRRSGAEFLTVPLGLPMVIERDSRAILRAD